MLPLMAGGCAVAPWITYLFCGILVALILCLAFDEKIHAKKSVIAGAFAVICLLLGAALHLLPFGQVRVAGVGLPDGILPPDLSAYTNGQAVNLPDYDPSIDWVVIAIILGSSLFVNVTSKSGLFTWIAIRLTKASGGDPLKLLWLYGLMTVVFSAVLNNVTAMIIVGSLTAVSLGKLDRNDKLLGFLLVQGLLTNIGGLLTLISSVPNIIVGTAADIFFFAFCRSSTFVWVCGTSCNICRYPQIIVSFYWVESKSISCFIGRNNPSIDQCRVVL